MIRPPRPCLFFMQPCQIWSSFPWKATSVEGAIEAGNQSAMEASLAILLTDKPTTGTENNKGTNRSIKPQRPGDLRSPLAFFLRVLCALRGDHFLGYGWESCWGIHGPHRSSEFIELTWNRAQYVVDRKLRGYHINGPHSESYLSVSPWLRESLVLYLTEPTRDGEICTQNTRAARSGRHSPADSVRDCAGKLLRRINRGGGPHRILDAGQRRPLI